MDKHSKFMRLCCQYVEIVTGGRPFVVWSCKTLKNSKCLISTPLDKSPYFEFTMNGDNGDIYVDEYVKRKNSKFNIKEAP